MGVVSPHFKMNNFLSHPMPFGWGGVFAALPFAVWFYLAIEGVAMVAEEVKEPKRNIPKGYIYGLGHYAFAGIGRDDTYRRHNGLAQTQRHLDYPLPEAIGIVLGKANQFTKVFASIGLFGLIASFHGTILASSRQLFAMARSGYLPRVLAQVNQRFKTPHWALLLGD
jgi:ethanolamine permease